MARGPRVLLLGASGFVGGAVADVLAGDPRVDSLVRVGSRAHGSPAEHWVRQDLVDGPPEDILALLRSTAPDVVVNCVGRLGGTGAELIAWNTLLVARLVDALSQLPRTRLVTLGSAAEYGVVPAGHPVPEDYAGRPVGVYGGAKLAATTVVRSAVEAGTLDGVVLRVFNPIGTGLPAETLLGRAAASFRAALLAGGDEIVLGPLSAYRDFVDVRDVATAVAAAVLADRLAEPVLNVGSGIATPIRAAVTELADLAGFRGRIRETDAPPSRSSSVDWIAADLSLTRGSLGWNPQHDLSGSLKAVWTT